MTSSRPLKNPLPRIDGYRIEGVLGRGSTGVVYSAVQLAVDRPVAIKVLHPELVGSKRAVRRLQREARTAARLAHPGIISAIDMGEQDGLWWYAMELVEGISLGERLAERGPMTEREALRFFLPLVEALEHAFESGVVHRDIKPSNILVDAHGKARLVDLGLAFSEDDPMLTRPGGTLGTPHYISPEQACDPGAADTRSDLWSLGASMYHAVCGRPPFQGDSVAEILSGVLHQRVPDPRLFAPQLSKGFTLVLRKCLTRDAQGRYQDPGELRQDLVRVVERRAPEVRVSLLDPIDDGRPPWLRKALVGAGAVLVVLVALLLWRPWAGAPQAPPLAPTVAISWPALERLRTRYAAQELSIAAASRQLAALALVPEGGEPMRADFKSLLDVDLEQAIAGLVRELDRSLDEDLAARDLVRAQATIDAVPRELSLRTGIAAVEDLPDPRSRAQFEQWLGRKRDLLERGRESARHDAAALLKGYLAREVVPAAERALEAHCWVDTQELLRSRLEWLGEAGVGPGLLPADAQAVLYQEAAALDGLTNSIFYGYESTLVQLEDFLREQEAELRGWIDDGTLGAAAALRARFEDELDRRGIDPAQVPVDYRTRRPLRGRLELLARELQEHEERVLRQDARVGLLADQVAADAYCAARRYDQALALWDARLAEGWRAAVRAEMVDRRREAELLEELMRGAAEALHARHGGSLDMVLADITHEGARVIAPRPAGELLVEGFELDLPGPGPSVRVHLRRAAPEAGLTDGYVLPRATVLDLGGLAGEPVAPEEQFLRALFLFHEGDPSGASAALPRGSFEDVQLLEPLSARIQADLEARRAQETARRQQKALALDELRRNLLAGRSTPEALLEVGGRLLGEYRDLLSRAERDEVEDICAALRRKLSPPTLAGAYSAARIEELRKGGVVLTWDFEAVSRGAWELGDWDLLPGHLRLRTPREDLASFWSRERALRLPLGRPLDAGADLDLSLRLRWADEHRDLDNDVVLSIAGTHLLFVDAPAGRPRRWAVTREEPRAALERLHAQPDPNFSGFDGFPREGEYVLRVELAAGRGRMRVWLDDRELRMPRELLKTQPPDQPELSLHTRSRLELFDVQLAATRIE